MTKLMVIYSIPENKDHFKKHYQEVHIPLFKKIPGVVRTQYSIAPVTLDGSGRYFCILEAEFESDEALEKALSSEEARLAGEDVANYTTEPPTVLKMNPIEV